MTARDLLACNIAGGHRAPLQWAPIFQKEETNVNLLGVLNDIHRTLGEVRHELGKIQGELIEIRSLSYPRFHGRAMAMVVERWMGCFGSALRLPIPRHLRKLKTTHEIEENPVFELLSEHQFWAAVAIYWIFSAAVSSMPDPANNGNPGYLWLYRFLHTIAGNITTAFSEAARYRAGASPGSKIQD